MTTSAVSLDSKYRTERGRIFLAGIQALVRVPIDQHRADRRRGLDTATIISGYPGSPLGGFELNLVRNAALLSEHNVHFVPGLNEELGATVVWGGQLSRAFPRPKHDGVLGMWYGKTPGLDRTGDLFRHANLAGVGPLGGRPRAPTSRSRSSTTAPSR
jgi:indolepyruvate ferredoxin oxidoreductase